MKQMLAAGALLSLVVWGQAGQAQAQSAVNWTGCYGGVNIGAAWSNLRITDVGNAGGVAYAGGGTAGQKFSANAAAPTGGVQLGCNYQTAPLLAGLPAVFGAEAEGGYMSLDSRKLDPGSTSNTMVGIKSGFYGDLTLRLGTSFDKILLYGKGGVAILDATTTFSTQSVGSTATTAGTFSGYVAGGGAEYRFMPDWSAKAEILHYGFGTQQFNVSAPGGNFPFKEKLSVNTIKIGVNYFFGAPAVPPPPMATPAAAPAPAAIAPKKQIFIVFFEFDKSSLTPDGRKVVDAAAAAFKSGKSDVAVAGYTDLAGSQQYNLALSHRRADAVKAALVKDGVSTSAIGESWYGKQNPRVPTADGVREPQNRRVEITM